MLGDQPTLRFGMKSPRGEQGVAVNWKSVRNLTKSSMSPLFVLNPILPINPLCLNAKTLRMSLIIQNFIRYKILDYVLGQYAKSRLILLHVR